MLGPDEGSMTWFEARPWIQLVTPAGFEVFEDTGEPATVPGMPTHQTRKPTVEQLAAAGQSVGWVLEEPQPPPAGPERTGQEQRLIDRLGSGRGG
jgi:hypothetical protein